MTPETKTPVDRRATDLARYRAVRDWTEHIVAPLEIEDRVVQTMPDVSPTKWHLAHTSWFFETFLLTPHLPGYRSPRPEFESLFNSYYNSVGTPFHRPSRGTLSRPTVAEVDAYRAAVDEGMTRWIEAGHLDDPSLRTIFETGLQHEQQHQELIVTDLKHVLAANVLEPVYRARSRTPATEPAPLGWVPFDEGIRSIGVPAAGLPDGAFTFDNERATHRVFLESFELATRPVTAGEFIDFIEDGGYRTHSLWLSDGWSRVAEERWEAPLYWRKDDGAWTQFTLSGRRPVDRAEPVVHISHFEADAFARWAGHQWVGARLPTEFEWEVAAGGLPVAGRFADTELFHPAPAEAAAPDRLVQMFGDVWEWTASPYTAYPGFRTADGALGEYNGKFMSGPMVLRGGSIASPPGHLRATYRNFWHPSTRFQFAGLRLARSR